MKSWSCCNWTFLSLMIRWAFLLKVFPNYTLSDPVNQNQRINEIATWSILSLICSLDSFLIFDPWLNDLNISIRRFKDLKMQKSVLSVNCFFLVINLRDLDINNFADKLSWNFTLNFNLISFKRSTETI